MLATRRTVLGWPMCLAQPRCFKLLQMPERHAVKFPVCLSKTTNAAVNLGNNSSTKSTIVKCGCSPSLTAASTLLPRLSRGELEVNTTELHMVSTQNKITLTKLGLWKGSEIHATSFPGSKPFHCHCHQHMRVPHVHLKTLKKEVDRLIEIGVLEKTDGTASSWCAPPFITQKKDGRVPFVADFHELNKWIEQHPWPMPHITDLVDNLGKCACATCLFLSVGFCHMKLSEAFSNLTQSMLPFGCCKHKHWPVAWV